MLGMMIMIFESNAFWILVIIVMVIVSVWLIADLVDRYLDKRERALFDEIFNEFDDYC